MLRRGCGIVATLGASAAFDYDPTQMQGVIYKLDELINALRRAQGGVPSA